MLVHLVPFMDLEEQVTQLSVKGIDEKSAQRPGSNGLIAQKEMEGHMSVLRGRCKDRQMVPLQAEDVVSLMRRVKGSKESRT